MSEDRELGELYAKLDALGGALRETWAQEPSSERRTRLAKIEREKQDTWDLVRRRKAALRS